MMKRMETIESEKNNLLKNVTLLNEKIQILSQNQSKVNYLKSLYYFFVLGKFRKV